MKHTNVRFQLSYEDESFAAAHVNFIDCLRAYAFNPYSWSVDPYGVASVYIPSGEYSRDPQLLATVLKRCTAPGHQPYIWSDVLGEYLPLFDFIKL
jgi:hypothetical protein